MCLFGCLLAQHLGILSHLSIIKKLWSQAKEKPHLHLQFPSKSGQLYIEAHYLVNPFKSFFHLFLLLPRIYSNIELYLTRISSQDVCKHSILLGCVCTSYSIVIPVKYLRDKSRNTTPYKNSLLKATSSIL